MTAEPTLLDEAKKILAKLRQGGGQDFKIMGLRNGAGRLRPVDPCQALRAKGKYHDSVSAMAIQFMSRRRARRLSAVLGLAAILFAQAALALVACNLDGGTPSRGTAVTMAAAETPSPCHEQAPANDKLCVAHCQASDQTLDKYQAKLPVLPVGGFAVVQVDVNRHPPVFLPPVGVPVASPPARIVFQSLLI
ncbi:MAG TPA: hypothetical protein VNZ59_09820 [Burkholderiales bacterium]|nr:hypothetical protein [Burkholderiales bacterium]